VGVDRLASVPATELSVLNEQLGLNHAKAGTGGADKESVESCGANGQQFGNLFLKGCNVVILERQMPRKQHKQDYPTRPKSLQRAPS